MDLSAVLAAVGADSSSALLEALSPQTAATLTVPPNNHPWPISNLKLDAGFSPIGVAASPLVADLSTAASVLSPSALEELNKLMHSSGITPNTSPELLHYLRGAMAFVGQQQQQVAAAVKISTSIQSQQQSIPSPMESNVELSADGEIPRRIRRRRPKSPKTEKNESQPMNTPDDPVIHTSPDQMFGERSFGPNGPGTSSTEFLSAEEQRRRQKTCRVCGDHATGYNFNVITCESCKAFFRRNALRPKDFKCPYSDDCEINSVSRRFCQKCRLAKCFTVGMKKEWILNEEQLRRRKNSRLNNLKSPGSESPFTPPASVLGKPMDSIKNEIPEAQKVINPTQFGIQTMTSLGGFQPYLHQSYGDTTLQQFLNAATQQQQSFVSPPPPKRRLSELSLSPSSSLGSSTMLSPHAALSPASPAPVPQKSLHNDVIMHNGMPCVALPVDEYSRIIGRQTDEPEMPSPMMAEQKSMFTPYPFRMPAEGTLPSTAFDLTSTTDTSPQTAMKSPIGASPPVSSHSMSAFPFHFSGLEGIHDTIKNELDASTSVSVAASDPPSPEIPTPTVNFKTPTQSKSDYQLNATELCELDVVRDAFRCMDEPLNSESRGSICLTKKNHNAADILNIMDITMRRFVKMTKRLTCFNSFTQEGKLALLKSAMIQMLTIRGVTRFDPSRFSFMTPVAGPSTQTAISCEMFDKLNKENNQKDRFIRFCSTINEHIRKNELAINIIDLVILFRNPSAVTHPKDRKAARQYNQLYSNLLRRYIESVHGDDAAAILKTIPATLAELASMSEVAENMFIGKVKPGETEQLPTEFFKTQPDTTSREPTSSRANQAQPESLEDQSDTQHLDPAP